MINLSHHTQRLGLGSHTGGDRGGGGSEFESERVCATTLLAENEFINKCMLLYEERCKFAS